MAEPDFASAAQVAPSCKNELNMRKALQHCTDVRPTTSSTQSGVDHSGVSASYDTVLHAQQEVPHG